MPMMGKVGMGIAFNARPTVQVVAPVKVNSTSLLSPLCLLEFSRERVLKCWWMRCSGLTSFPLCRRSGAGKRDAQK